MSFFANLEGNLEKYIEGFFKDHFTGAVRPVDIAKELVREMQRLKTASVTKVYVPNEYLVRLSPSDWEAIAVFAPSLQQELTEYLLGKAEEKKFIFVDRPTVNFEVDVGLHQGKMRVEGRFATKTSSGAAVGHESLPSVDAGDTKVFPAVEEKTFTTGEQEHRIAQLVVIQGSEPGHCFNVFPYRMVIGRSNRCSVIINDPNVSRRHAQIEFVGGSFILTDLGSTNGTMVNGRPIEKCILQNGDEIVLGTTVLQFRLE